MPTGLRSMKEHPSIVEESTGTTLEIDFVS